MSSERAPESALTGYRARLLDYTGDPTDDPSAIRLVEDGLLVARGEHIVARGDHDTLLPSYPGLEIVDYRGLWLVPGFVDAHVHFPQLTMIAAYGTQLLEWLTNYAFPAERRFADPAYGEQMASVFLKELFRNGTTAALVLGSVHSTSVDSLARSASALRMRLIIGKVLMDRNAPADLLDTAETGYTESLTLIERWHGRGRISYAVTPRFAPCCSPEQLEAAGELLREHPSVYLHTHLAENQSELAWVTSLFPERRNYTDVYDHYGLIGPRSVFAHGIHLSESELTVLSDQGATIAFCPTSNLFLGSGLFPLHRVRAAGVNVAIGTDVGGGTSFSLLRTLSEGYKVLQLQGSSLGVHSALYLATLGGARSLSLAEEIGSLEPGKVADFTVLDGACTPLLTLRSAAAQSAEDALFALLMLADDRAVAATYVAGRVVHERDGVKPWPSR
jgi:guanine deaminase